MIRNPVDVSVLVSPRLSALIEKVVNDPDATEPVTLGKVRDFLQSLLPQGFVESERLHHIDIGESLLDELNTLIEEFGEDALASDFVRAYASEALSRVIEVLLDHEETGEEGEESEEREGLLTLAGVRQAIANGIGAHLVGEGVLDEDEDEGLAAEIDALIEHYGPDKLAEEVLRYE